MDVTTGLVRISYPSLFKPQDGQKKGDTPKYKVCVLIPKNAEGKETIRALKAAIKDAIANDKTFNGKKPSKRVAEWGGIKDGDEEKADVAGFAGCYYFNATTTRPPFVVDKRRNPILDEEEVYPGCWGRISVNTFTYNFDGVIGVGFALNGFQKLKDDERLGGSRINADKAFADDWEGDDEEEDEDDAW